MGLHHSTKLVCKRHENGLRPPRGVRYANSLTQRDHNRPFGKSKNHQKKPESFKRRIPVTARGTGWNILLESLVRDGPMAAFRGLSSKPIRHFGLTLVRIFSTGLPGGGSGSGRRFSPSSLRKLSFPLKIYVDRIICNKLQPSAAPRAKIRPFRFWTK